MTHKYVAITKIGVKYEQVCGSMKEGLAIHQKLIDAGWQIECHSIFKMEDGAEIQLASNLH